MKSGSKFFLRTEEAKNENTFEKDNRRQRTFVGLSDFSTIKGGATGGASRQKPQPQTARRSGKTKAGRFLESSRFSLWRGGSEKRRGGRFALALSLKIVFNLSIDTKNSDNFPAILIAGN